MKKTEFLTYLKDLLMAEVKLEQMQIGDGAIIEAEVFEAGYEVVVVNGEERFPLGVGEYDLGDGRMLIVEQEGVIADIKLVETPEEETTETPVDAPAEVATEMAAEEMPVTRAEFMEALKMIEMLQDALEAMKNPEVEVEMEETKLSEQTPSFKHSPEKVNEVKPLQLSKSNKSNTQSRVFGMLFNK